MSSVVDRFLEHCDPWHLEPSEAEAMRFAAIAEAFAHHYRSCATYQRLCQARGLTPEELRGPQDLGRIPLLSTRAFKEQLALLSVPPSAIVKTHHSSGTSGTMSLVPRDAVTLERFTRSLQRTILDVQGDSGFIALLGPSPEELADLSFSMWAAVGCSLARGHEFFFRGFQFDPERVVDTVNSTPHRPVEIGGAPMLILALASYIQQSGRRITTLTADSRVTSGGGFKSLAGETIRRSLYDEQVMAAFGVPRSNIRDAYAMSEINGAITECAENLKHVPPWLHLSLRHPADLHHEVGLGEEGLPAILDPCAHSYPGFLLADDVARMVVGAGERCRCGRIGPCLAPDVRRAEGAEARGCGRHIEELRAVAAES